MPITLQQTPRLRKALNFLRKNFPTKSERSVTVRIVKELEGLHGLVEFEDEGHKPHAYIRIAEDNDYLMVETLLEEWSHILRQDTPVPLIKDHDSIFWAIYGTVVMAFRGGE